MSRISRITSIAIIAAASIAAAMPASAQGNGNAFGRHKNAGSVAPSAASGGSGAQLPPSGTGIRNFGAWLDDASTLPQGRGYASISFGYWRTPSFREIDLPVVDGGIALAPRVQVGFSMPFYHVNEPGGLVARGLGDLYLNAKIQLRDPASSASGVGFAVIPVLEILSTRPRADKGRVQWALPASIEVQRSGWRAFGAAGYFSRGSLFASGGLEAALSDRAWVMGTITQSHSIEIDELSAAMGLSQTRTDVSGGVIYAVSPVMSVFGSVGRTISKRDPNSATVGISAGVSFAF